jgi:broad specificity phosphatase PhoE
MNRLYFVRHGEGQDNVARQFSSRRIDNSLTERGTLQARQTADFLACKSIHEIYTSPMKRALETARIITTRLGKELTILENFREVNVGDLEGKYFSDENWGLYHRITSEWFEGKSDIAFPGGENYATMWERWRDGLVQILKGKADRDILLVGHAGIFIATLKDLCPALDVNWLKNAECYNCSITELEVDVLEDALTGCCAKPRGRLVTWAGHQHLSGEALWLVPGIPPVESLGNSSSSMLDK